MVSTVRIAMSKSTTSSRFHIDRRPRVSSSSVSYDGSTRAVRLAKRSAFFSLSSQRSPSAASGTMYASCQKPAISSSSSSGHPLTVLPSGVGGPLGAAASAGSSSVDCRGSPTSSTAKPAAASGSSTRAID